MYSSSSGPAAYPPTGGYSSSGFNNAAYNPAYPPPGSGYGAPPPGSYNTPPSGYAAPPPGSYNQPSSGHAAPPPGYSSNQTPNPSRDPPPASGAAYTIESPEFAGRGFTEKAIRLRFIRKVYLILTSQLLVTLGLIAFFLFHQPTKDFVQSHGYLYYISYAIFLVTYIALVCCKNVRRKTPGNYICLVIFTLAFSYMAATISSFHDIEAVLIAMGITCGVCVGVTLFAIQTKFDFTRCGGLLFCLLLVLLLFGLSIIIVFAVAPVDQRTAKILQCVYGGLGALVFSLFLAYDTQLVVGGRRYEYSEEDYVSAAVQLYLDVVYIFLFILTIMGGSGD